MALLENLVFSDLFVSNTNQTSWYKQTPDSLRTTLVPPDYFNDLTKLRNALKSKAHDDFRINWPDESGFRLRVVKQVTVNDEPIFVCRRFRIAAGTLASLGMPLNIAEKLMAPDLREGLVILFGKTGSGKTTTAASFVRERLDRFGGVCWTIENPVELNLEGVHGKGVCYQTEIESDDEIEHSLHHIYRATPNIIFIGELRTSAAVREAISASTSGHLVVATFHAGDLVAGVARLARMAGGDTANASLSDALRVAIHVSLHNAENRPLPGISDTQSRGTGTPPRVLSVTPLWMTSEISEALKSIVRDGKFEYLKSEIERQKREFLMARLPQ